MADMDFCDFRKYSGVLYLLMFMTWHEPPGNEKFGKRKIIRVAIFQRIRAYMYSFDDTGNAHKLIKLIAATAIEKTNFAAILCFSRWLALDSILVRISILDWT